MHILFDVPKTCGRNEVYVQF